MTLQRLLHEAQGSSLVPGLRDVALEDLALLVDGAPEVNHLAVQPDVHLVEVPAPLAKTAHPVHPLPAYVGGEHRTEPVPPVAHGLMADVDAALGQQVLDVPQRQREPDIHHHHEADHLGRGVNVPKRAGWFAWARHSPPLPRFPHFASGAILLTVPWHMHFGTMCFNRAVYLWPALKSETRGADFYSGILADWSPEEQWRMKPQVAVAFGTLGLHPNPAA